MRNLGIVLACGIVSASSSHADVPSDDKMRMVLRWADPTRMAGARIDDTLPVIVAFMRANDIDGVPGLSYDDAKMRVRMDNASRGLEPMQRVLASDLDGNLEVTGTVAPQPDPVLQQNLARAHRWAKRLRNGESLSSIAKAENCSDSLVRSRVALAFLAPDLQRAIFDGTAPSHLTTNLIVRMTLPHDWQEQAKALGL